MRIDDLFRLCEKLQYSQGFYGRLLRELNNMDEIELADLDLAIQQADLKDELDLILWLES